MNYVEELEEELEQLNNRLKKISRFLGSISFRIIPHKQKVLLMVQESHMINYKNILISRLEYLKEDPSNATVFNNFKFNTETKSKNKDDYENS